MRFYKRTEEPDEMNPCYTTIPRDVLKFDNGSVLPNCVGYVVSRCIEIYGSQRGLVGVNATDFYEFNHSQCGWLMRTEPTLGAIACWNGHCAIVEDYDLESIVVSQSHYNGVRFDVIRIKRNADYNGMKFQGFLVPDLIDWDNEPNVPRGTFPPVLHDNYYRIRPSWEDASHQKGAYHFLSNAIHDLQYYPGYHIYSPDGTVVM